MRKSEYEIAIQGDPLSFYGGIAIEVYLDDKKGLDVFFKYKDVLDWSDSIRFGFLYAQEKIERFKKLPRGNGIKIHVLEVRSQVVDTTHIVMAYVAAQVLLKAFDMNPSEHMKFDKENCMFSFFK